MRMCRARRVARRCASELQRFCQQGGKENARRGEPGYDCEGGAYEWRGRLARLSRVLQNVHILFPERLRACGRTPISPWPIKGGVWLAADQGGL